MRVTTITCDHCGADLSKVNTPAESYRLTLTAERINNQSAIRYAMYFPPPVIGEANLCNWACLSGWLAMKGAGNG